jgi:hypothetical protein
MKPQDSFSRRFLVKSSVFGLLSASIPSISYSKEILYSEQTTASVPDRYTPF